MLRVFAIIVMNKVIPEISEYNIKFYYRHILSIVDVVTPREEAGELISNFVKQNILPQE